ncbi:NAD(P)-binding domain-containing protein [Streptosporangium vulgare]|uniref:NAD(P)-binding domain-containing protein n=1 Tax=Streptosporangium vulgare TaxID=46190 RepID=UPI0031E41368
MPAPRACNWGTSSERRGRSYSILEAGPAPGTFFRTFPRHRQLISINKRYTGTDDPELNLRMDWNSLLSDDPALLFTRYSDRYFPEADDMVRYLADFAAACDLRVTYDARVSQVTRAPGTGPLPGDRRARPDPRGQAAGRRDRGQPAQHPADTGHRDGRTLRHLLHRPVRIREPSGCSSSARATRRSRRPTAWSRRPR